MTLELVLNSRLNTIHPKIYNSVFKNSIDNSSSIWIQKDNNWEKITKEKLEEQYPEIFI